MARYEPADSFETPRFSGVMTFVRLPNNRDLEEAGCGVVGVRPAYDDPGRIARSWRPTRPASSSA